MSYPDGRMAARFPPTSTPAIWKSPRLAAGVNGASTAARLLAFALPAMEALYRQFADPGLTVLLSDQDGAILCMIGAGVAQREALDASRSAVPEESLVGPWPERWQRRAGPPGIATLRLDPAQADPALLGIAAPVLSPDQRVLGMLGAVGFFGGRPASSEQLTHPNALLHTTVEIIEHRMIEHDERGFLVLRFHPRRGMLGSPLEALAVFDHDSRLVAANRVARRLLPDGDRANGAQCSTLFDAPWQGLVGYAALCLADPFKLRVRGGTPLFAQALLR